MATIRARYDVPATRGRAVLFCGDPARILSALKGPQHLRLRMEDGRRVIVHPTWELDYLDGRGVR